jgi:hypothetical protein
MDQPVVMSSSSSSSVRCRPGHWDSAAAVCLSTCLLLLLSHLIPTSIVTTTHQRLPLIRTLR